jgi:hypothetical protein
MILYSLKVIDRRGIEYNLLQEAFTAFEAVQKIHNQGYTVKAIYEKN